ncbi:extracellular solute-binding protein [Actinomadura luteofluorescens]|uniref:extracellular solute-binding protein n=1 Tax=Actinomadura luteofluorescens TaxID=46163 RepID=UPI00362F44F5
MVFSSRDFSRRRIGAAAALALAGAALAGCGGGSPADPDRGKDAKSFSLTITRNAIAGGKNTEEAEWITRTLIPKFVAAQKAKGVTAKVSFRGQGVDDEVYKTKLALDLKSRSGADIMDIDGIWVGEFAQAGYILPLSKAVGAPAAPGRAGRGSPARSSGWRRSRASGTASRPRPTAASSSSTGSCSRGRPARGWQPKSWQEIIEAGRALKKLPGVTPIQLNAGTAMGEATSMQGALPLLAGAGAEIWADGKWTGGGQALKQVLGLYAQVYGREGLGDPKLQQEAKGRDKSFEEFAAGKIGILFEGDYFWRDVLNPKTGVAKMATRDQDVGYALIPAASQGRGLRGQSFVSMSGGSVTVLNPNTKFPQQAFELLAFMNSPEMVKARTAGTPEITSRTDVNKEILANDPFLTFVSEKVLPVTSYRPGLSAYPQVSTALQEATASVVAGRSPDQAAAEYAKKLEGIAGGAAHVAPR